MVRWEVGFLREPGLGEEVRTPSSHNYVHSFVISLWHSMR